MKKAVVTLMTAFFAVSMFSGCNKTTITESSGEVTLATEAAPAVTEGEAEVSLPATFDEAYGPQLANYLDHQYYYDDEAIPLTVSNFYFITCFQDFDMYVYYGNYPGTAMGHLDLAASFPEGIQYDTCAELFIDYVQFYLEHDIILSKRAAEEGFTLSEERYQDINTILDNITTDAASAGLSFDEYIQIYYGPGMTKESFTSILEMLFIVFDYPESYYADYIEQHKDTSVPYVRYALFYAPETAEQSEKDKALERATALKDGCTSLDDLTTLAQNAEELGIVYEQGDRAVFEDDDPLNVEWAYDEDRKEGDIDIVYYPDWGYYVLGYIGIQMPDDEALQNRAQTLLEYSVSEEINSKVHNLHTDDEYLPSPAAPTATPVPTESPYSDIIDGQSGDTAATVPTGSVDQAAASSMNASEVLAVVFITLASVAVLAVVVIMIYSVVNGKKNNDGPSKKGGRDKVGDEAEDEAEAEDAGDKADSKDDKSKSGDDDEDKADESEDPDDDGKETEDGSLEDDKDED